MAAIGRICGTGTESGAEVRVPLGLAYTIRGGVIVRVEEFLDPGEALSAVRLEE